MKLLAWDTSSTAGVVVASEWATDRPLEEAKLLSEWTLSVETSHSDGLLAAIHHVLRAVNWDLKDVDIFGVGIGPGSFTGLRIGITTARTWAESLSKPVVGVCSLAVLARAYLPPSGGKPLGSQPVVVSRNAFGGEVYVLEGPAKQVARASVPPQKGFKSAWPREVKLRTQDETEFRKARAKKPRISPPFAEIPQGRTLALVCWEAIKGGCARQASEIQPLYMRDSSAQVKMARGELKVSPTES